MKNLKIYTLLLLMFSNAIIFAQKEKEIKVKSGENELYGSLIKVKKHKNHPVVLIIAGSGSTDRNGNSAMTQNNAYRLMAKELAEHNISSLRYDKLGAGKSIPSNFKEEDLLFENYVDDAEAWLNYLKKQDFGQYIVIGHSEGSMIGMLLTARGEVDKFISIAGAGRPIGDILLEQLTAQDEKIAEKAKPIIDSLTLGKKVKDIPLPLMSLFRESVQPFLISWMQIDPVAVMKKIEVPAMVIQGSTDLQTKVNDAKSLAQNNGNLLIIEDMNHVLKVSSMERQENFNTYLDPSLPLHEELIPNIVKFIKE